LFGRSFALVCQRGGRGWRGAIADSRFGLFPALAAVLNHHVAVCLLDCFKGGAELIVIHRLLYHCVDYRRTFMFS